MRDSLGLTSGITLHNDRLLPAARNRERLPAIGVGGTVGHIRIAATRDTVQPLQEFVEGHDSRSVSYFGACSEIPGQASNMAASDLRSVASVTSACCQAARSIRLRM